MNNINGIKIAIVDTGICKDHPYLADSIYGGYSFVGNDCNDYQDQNGHGTLCTSVIKKECNSAQFYIIKALDSTNTSNLLILEDCLKYINKLNVKLCNLSLSLTEQYDFSELSRILSNITDSGVIVVCSTENGKMTSFPAALENVIGVRGAILESQSTIWFNERRKIQAIVDSNPYLHAYPGGTYQLFGRSNSFAAAKMSGIIANILSQEPDLSRKRLFEKLSAIAHCGNWDEKDLRFSKRLPTLFDNKSDINPTLLSKLESLTQGYWAVSNEDLYLYGMFSHYIGMDASNCFMFLQHLEKALGLRISNYTNISRYDLFTFLNIANLIDRYMI